MMKIPKFETLYERYIFIGLPLLKRMLLKNRK